MVHSHLAIYFVCFMKFQLDELLVWGSLVPATKSTRPSCSSRVQTRVYAADFTQPLWSNLVIDVWSCQPLTISLTGFSSLLDLVRSRLHPKHERDPPWQHESYLYHVLKAISVPRTSQVDDHVILPPC